MSIKQTLVIGGSSGIGAAVVKSFLGPKHAVSIIDQKTPDFDHPMLSYFKADITNLLELQKKAKSIPIPSLIVHSAGVRLPETGEGIGTMMNVNVFGTLHIITTFRKLMNQTLFLHLSSDLIRRGDVSAYAKTKRAALTFLLKEKENNPSWDMKVAFLGPVDTPLFGHDKSDTEKDRIQPMDPWDCALELSEFITAPEPYLVCTGKNETAHWEYMKSDHFT